MQFNKDISNDLKKLDKYFNGTAIGAFKNNLCALEISGLVFAATSFVVNPFNTSHLYLEDNESFAFTLSIFHDAFKFCSSLLYFHNDPEDCS